MGALRSDAGRDPQRMEERSLYLWDDDDGNFGRRINDETIAGRICRRSVANLLQSSR